ncbi:MAG: hypothetical protein ABJB40_07535 [Acidobacteriota bacterium]
MFERFVGCVAVKPSLRDEEMAEKCAGKAELFRSSIGGPAKIAESRA